MLKRYETHMHKFTIGIRATDQNMCFVHPRDDFLCVLHEHIAHSKNHACTERIHIDCVSSVVLNGPDIQTLQLAFAEARVNGLTKTWKDAFALDQQKRVWCAHPFILACNHESVANHCWHKRSTGAPGWVLTEINDHTRLKITDAHLRQLYSTKPLRVFHGG